MERPTLELAYDVTLDDVHAFNLHYSRTAPHARRSRNAVRAALTFMLAVLLVSLGVLSKAPLPFWLMGALILGGWWATFPKRAEQMLKANTARAYADGKNLGLLGPQRLSLEAEWLSERTPVREVRTHLSALEKVVLTDEYLYLYVTAFSAVIVPLRAFASKADAAAFAQAVEERRQTS